MAHNTHSENPVIFFDGVCNLCNGFVRFVIRHDQDNVFKFAALQSDPGQKILEHHHLPPDRLHSVILWENGRVMQQSDAVLAIARRLPRFRWLTNFRILPRFIRDFLYQLIARNRYWLFGRQESCMLPTPELLERFL